MKYMHRTSTSKTKWGKVQINLWIISNKPSTSHMGRVIRLGTMSRKWIGVSRRQITLVSREWILVIIRISITNRRSTKIEVKIVTNRR